MKHLKKFNESEQGCGCDICHCEEGCNCPCCCKKDQNFYNDLFGSEEEQVSQGEVTITISGFKTLEEAKKWCDAYSGGVEQDMSIWAEGTSSQGGGYQFPCYHKQTNVNGNNIEMVLTHPDEYKK